MGKMPLGVRKPLDTDFLDTQAAQEAFLGQTFVSAAWWASHHPAGTTASTDGFPLPVVVSRVSSVL